MANQWAIAIGINTYRSFQSLNYAQQDAEALCRHLIDSGITAPENCLLLTTASALHRGHSTFPERETIAKWLKGLVIGAMGPDDSLLLFFSGYGVHANGEDYLMPVDGDPTDAAATGIAVKSIYRLLSQVPSGKVLIALDMNRNAGSLAEPAGAYSARIAQQASQQYPEMATLLSCQPPEQFARESAGLRHGFFTAGILDVLRSRQREQPGTVLEFKDFGKQLGDRMAELCDHYWRPIQTPVAIGNYSIPLGQTAANALVSSGVAGVAQDAAPDIARDGVSSNGKAVDVETNGAAANGAAANGAAANGAAANGAAANGESNNGDWGNAIAVGPQADMGESAPSPISPTENILSPLDISRPADVSEGFGDDFAGTWPLEDEGETEALNQGSPNGHSAPGHSSNSATPSSAVDLDPYAAAWEEDFGDTVPFDANSDVVLNAKAQLAQQEAELSHDSNSVLSDSLGAWQNGSGQVSNGSGNGTSNVTEQSGNGFSSQGIVGEPVRGGRPGHGGDGTDWHWADLSVAAATEDGPTASELDEVGLDDEAANIFEYPDSPNSFPEPGPNATANGLAAGAGLVIATRPGLEQANGQPAQAQEDPNWNWSGGETAIDVEPHDDLEGQLNNDWGEHPNDEVPIHDQQIHAAASYEEVDSDWPEHALDLDDDPEGLPIVDLESEEFVPLAAQGESISHSRGRPAWLSLRLLGCLGVTALVALGLLGFFRGSQGEGLLPTLQSKFSLPSGFSLPGSGKTNQDPTSADPTASDSANGSANPATVTPATTPPETIAPEASPSDSPAATNEPSAEATKDVADSDRPNDSDALAPTPTNQTNAETQSSDAPQTPEPEFSDSSDLLDNAQQRIQAGQASSFNRAIDIARQVPPEDPDYDRARQSMNQWSQEVLSLSQQRAQEGQYLQAIATARLVPSDLTGFNEAQQSINQWQIPAQLEHAKAVTRPGQASSYNRAIGIARNVPVGSDSHPQAQKLMQSWGNDIFEIAQQRANNKQWSLAIAAAELVPPDMPAYGAAQSAIADWQPQLNKPK